MATLWDIAQLRPLADVGRDHNVTFALRGGVAFRFALDPSTTDLFRLIPFTSDIDLVHSGKPSSTASILADILSAVPSAECFRWELLSKSEISNDRPGLQGNIIPARHLELTSLGENGFRDPANGLRDIASREFRYFRNPLFRQSQRFRGGWDQEEFSALLYLQTIGEAISVYGEIPRQLALLDVRAVFMDGLSDPTLVPRLQHYPYLRARLRHLLKGAITSFHNAEDLQGAADSCGLRDWLSHILALTPALAPDMGILNLIGLAYSPGIATIVSSDLLLGDTYRLDVPSGVWQTQTPKNVVLPELASDERFVLISPEIKVNSGKSFGPMVSALRMAPEFAEGVGEEVAGKYPIQEFIHFEIPELSLQIPPEGLWVDKYFFEIPVLEQNISAYIVIRELDDSRKWTPLSVPCVVMFRDKGRKRLSIRMNCFGLLSALSAPTSAHIVVVALEDR